mmetsp:Transcript_51160/g.105796  ORF Transcript_51160/g.105796 Transcript_51160/m.105796 type:complete len:273 (+) Transcript_51160:302-1120(+)
MPVRPQAMETTRKPRMAGTLTSELKLCLSNSSASTRHTTPVMGSVLASSCSFVVCARPDPTGERCSTNWARAHRCALSIMEIICISMPSQWAEDRPPGSSGTWHWKTPPMIIRALEQRRSRPSRSRPQNLAVHIIKSTLVELIMVRAATVRNSNALLVRPISSPCTRPMTTTYMFSCDCSGGAGGRLECTSLESSQAHRAVVGCTIAVRAKGNGKMSCTTCLISRMTMMAAIHHMLVKAKTFKACFEGPGAGDSTTRAGSAVGESSVTFSLM